MPASDSFDEKIKVFREDELTAMLGVIEARLGNSTEQSSDLDRAQAIAHRLNNLHTGKSGLRPRDFYFQSGR